MKTLIRRLLTLFVALAIPATVLVALPQEAAAASVYSRVDLRGARLRAVQLSTLAVTDSRAFDASYTTMRYSRVEQVFNARVGGYGRRMAIEWRRQFAVGWIQKGGRISNISSAERRYLENRRRQIYGSGCSFCRDVDGTLGEAPLQVLQNPPARCGTGKSHFTQHNPWYAGRFKYSIYLNSCQTDVMIIDWDSCVYNLGAATGAAVAVFALIKKLRQTAGWASVAAGLLTAACWNTAQQLRRVQASSPLKAIIIRENPDRIMTSNPNGGVYTDWRWDPQL